MEHFSFKSRSVVWVANYLKEGCCGGNCSFKQLCIADKKFYSQCAEVKSSFKNEI